MYKVWKCSFCNKEFIFREDCEYHEMVEHEEVSDEAKVRIYCANHYKEPCEYCQNCYYSYGCERTCDYEKECSMITRAKFKPKENALMDILDEIKQEFN